MTSERNINQHRLDGRGDTICKEPRSLTGWVETKQELNLRCQLWCRIRLTQLDHPTDQLQLYFPLQKMNTTTTTIK